MSRPTIAITKFVGVCSLGLLTGISFSTSYASVKSLLTLPSAPAAHRSFKNLMTNLEILTTPLTVITTFSLLTSYYLSPPSQKHPYLIFTSVIPLLSGVYSFAILSPKAARMEKLIRENGEKGVNGEELRNGMVEWESASWGITGMSGLAFAMGVVGIWGDGS
ncbi:hypothetical protein H072_7832 [Dactylellina haptotyla CBS 200.50]|uniref:DUF1772 domain-containing protein n=1 Tax=Dactylellina haptotyla (strain CBS 200.50) TaxID=1284197 RepID=S8ABG0_DACHA|nr:hypothetical protein H072_7832 [Dactylellina haptotyla CBS 200.50]